MNEQIALTESTYYILLSLHVPQHGYGIMQQVEEMSGGGLNLLCATILMYALGRIHGKKEALIKERRLHE